MSHRGGPDHGNATSPWLGSPPRDLLTYADEQAAGPCATRLRRVLRAPFTRRTWAELAYAIVSFPLAVGALIFTVPTLVTGPLWAASAPGIRKLGAAHRSLARTLLGEDVTSVEQALAVVEQYRRILDRLHAEELRCNVAVKLTHLGLDTGEDVAYENLRHIVEHAAGRGNFIRIDMEYSAVVEATLRIYRRLREAGGSLALVITVPRIVRLFQITGLTKVLAIHPSVTEAITADPHWQHTAETEAGSVPLWCQQHDLP